MTFGDWNGDGHVSPGEVIGTGWLASNLAQNYSESTKNDRSPKRPKKGSDDGCGSCACGCVALIGIVFVIIIFSYGCAAVMSVM